jgi:hypothetical protein
MIFNMTTHVDVGNVYGDIMATAFRWGAESGMYLSMFGHDATQQMSRSFPNLMLILCSRFLSHRISIRFCVNIGKTPYYQWLVVNTLWRSEWHGRLKDGREDVLDDPRSGQSKIQRTDANVDRVRTLVLSDHRRGSILIAEEPSMDK